MSSVKHFFVPHPENNYHAHVLHTKRAVFYGTFFLALKAILVAFVLLIPVEVYVIPDVLKAQQEQLFSLTNEVRASHGIETLGPDSRLYTSAQKKAGDMAEKSYFAHTGPDGKSLASWLGDVGYPYKTAGENLAIGFTDPRVLVHAWMESPTHFANMIDTSYEETGIGLAVGLYNDVSVVYVSQHFGAEKTVTAPPPASTQETAMSEESLPMSTPEEALETEYESGTMSEAEEPVTVVSGSEVVSSPEHSTLPAEGASSSQKETFGAVLSDETDVLRASDTEKSPALSDEIGVSVEHVSDVEASAEIASSTPVSPIDLSRSLVSYRIADEGHLLLHAFAGINVPFHSATVVIGDTHITLQEQQDTYGIFSGEALIASTEHEYFQAILVPELRLVLEDGTMLREALRWEHIPQVGLTPLETYTTSKSLLGSLTPLFDITRGVYLGFLSVFTIALLLHIFWEIRVQHHHITIQTLGLLLLLVTLIAV